MLGTYAQRGRTVLETVLPEIPPPHSKSQEEWTTVNKSQPVGYGLLLHWQGTATKRPVSMVLGAGDTQMNTWEM